MLARACENEAENAKRMRIGMEPISQPVPTPLTYSSPLDMLATSSSSPLTLTVTMDGKAQKMEYKSDQLASLLGAAGGQQLPPQQQQQLTVTNSLNGVATNAMFKQALQQQQQQQQQQHQSQTAAASIYRNVPQPTPPNAGVLTSLSPSVAAAAAAMTNGGNGITVGGGGPVTLEALKKAGPLLNHKLNTTEMTAVRQLITGYRESAAFLLRSADELEHLIQLQPKL